jgi:hypothetical protein
MRVLSAKQTCNMSLHEFVWLPCDVYERKCLHSQARLLYYSQLAHYCFEDSLWASFHFREMYSRFQPNGCKVFLTPPCNYINLCIVRVTFCHFIKLFIIDERKNLCLCYVTYICSELIFSYLNSRPMSFPTENRNFHGHCKCSVICVYLLNN